jgi:hypothetical protein
MRTMGLLTAIGSSFISIMVATTPAIAEEWVSMGKAVTGEEIYVDKDSISSGREGMRFIYKIGNEILQAAANCEKNTWYVLEYDQTYSPQSTATAKMLDYVCSFDD